MTWRKRTIMEMALEAGFNNPVPADGYMGLAYDRREERETGGSLERFAALAREEAQAEEREEIAQFIEKTNLGSLPEATAIHYALLLKTYANAIRARGQA